MYSVIGKVIGQPSEMLYFNLPAVPRQQEVVIIKKRIFRIDEVIYDTDIPSIILWLYENDNDRVKADGN